MLDIRRSGLVIRHFQRGAATCKNGREAHRLQIERLWRSLAVVVGIPVSSVHVWTMRTTYTESRLHVNKLKSDQSRQFCKVEVIMMHRLTNDKCIALRILQTKYDILLECRA